MKIIWIIRTWLYRLHMKIKGWWNDTACQYMPKIQRKFPQPPNQNCPRCGRPINRIVAINTGDGWAFEWACENVDEVDLDPRFHIQEGVGGGS